MTDVASAKREGMREGVSQFALAILHGDEVHRGWLLEAAECFINGKPLPPPRDKSNTKEKP